MTAHEYATIMTDRLNKALAERDSAMAEIQELLRALTEKSIALNLQRDIAALYKLDIDHVTKASDRLRAKLESVRRTRDEWANSVAPERGAQYQLDVCVDEIDNILREGE